MTDRRMNMDILKNHSNTTIIHKDETPMADQVGVIWISEEGHPPKIPGMIFLLFRKFFYFRFLADR